MFTKFYLQRCNTEVTSVSVSSVSFRWLKLAHWSAASHWLQESVCVCVCQVNIPHLLLLLLLLLRCVSGCWLPGRVHSRHQSGSGPVLQPGQDRVSSQHVPLCWWDQSCSHEGKPVLVIFSWMFSCQTPCGESIKKHCDHFNYHYTVQIKVLTHFSDYIWFHEPPTGKHKENHLLMTSLTSVRVIDL